MVYDIWVQYVGIVLDSSRYCYWAPYYHAVRGTIPCLGVQVALHLRCCQRTLLCRAHTQPSATSSLPTLLVRWLPR